ncbi:hypothetical protein DFH27DRAFT_510405 [Peziza echinospora]|nr:hypothetical protein DFH27DRAFT_510405 [Peziza echinospora]
MAPVLLRSLFLATLAISLVTAHPAKYAKVLKREEAPKESYDYVIIGGGTSGLTVGDRLTEDGKYTVLVIEVGVLGGGGGMDPSRMYNINSVAQKELNNRAFSVGIGKVVGGSSAVNGMVFQRGAAEEYDIWGQLGGGNSTWNWDGILPYFKKGIHFTPPDANFAQQMNVTYDLAYWGQESKIYATFGQSGSGQQKFIYQAYAKFGVDVPKDGNGGKNGVTWFTTSMDPTATSRSYARTGHWDNINRANYELLTGSKVNKILFEGETAIGVQYVPASGSGAAVTVKANKEVILAAGAIHTPQVLQLSGIGPSALLKQANIPVLVDLPGVGYNFQDHSYLPNVGYSWGKTPSYPQVSVPNKGLFAPNLGIFIGLPVIAPDAYEAIATKYESQDPAQYLPTSAAPEVIEGYKQQQKVWGKAMRSKGVTYMNMMIMGPGGSPQNLKPTSRGTVLINPSNPQAEPIVDYRAMSNPIDMQITVEIIKFMRRFHTTGSLAEFSAKETSPGANVATDDQIATWIRGQITPSVFHPVGTAAKMPREWGGVVSEDLLVWGVKNLSIIDASIMPTTVGATTSMTVYAMAEKAADIIKSRQ